MTKSHSPLRAAVVGCNMGRNQADALAALPEFELAAVCDLNADTASAVAARCGNPAVYTDYDTMLETVRPELVVIATPNVTHAAFALKAADAGARGIYCEKPMATNLGDAREMVRVCEERGIVLVVGHQRRMNAVFGKMRELLDAGAIGDVKLIRGSCAGDLLSDASHTVDLMLYLLRDRPVRWALGQICRKPPVPPEVAAADRYAYTGRRYGHAVESGAAATFEFEGGVRGELLAGDLRFPGSGYQDIEVIGSEGRLWRHGDGCDPPLVIADGAAGGWRPVPVEEESNAAHFARVFSAMEDSLRTGAPHSMDGAIALRGLEMLIAVFESSRLRAKIEFPLKQEAFPLELMIAAGQF